MRIRAIGLTAGMMAALLLVMPTTVAAAEGTAEAEAVEAAKAWLSLIDAGEYGESWEGAAELFRNAVPQEKWASMGAGVRGPLGALVSREVKTASYKTSLPGAPDGEYVVIEFDTVFENKASAVETVTPMRDPDGEWRVSGYFIK